MFSIEAINFIQALILDSSAIELPLDLSRGGTDGGSNPITSNQLLKAVALALKGTNIYIDFISPLQSNIKKCFSILL